MPRIISIYIDAIALKILYFEILKIHITNPSNVPNIIVKSAKSNVILIP